MNFEKVNPKQSFPKLEENILDFWSENKIFEQSIENRKDAEEFNFYDGPPFATGTPHYGHILAGTIKDVIPRYQTMNGKRVERVFGWDCHGLPIENIVEKQMETGGREGIMKMGVHNFNESCRANVSTYTNEWKKTVNRMGRWVDMENAYHTMDTPFMESVWWVYKKLYDKGLIYEGHRVVPYCPRCTTPLSNFEVNQGYKDKQDKTLTVKFKIVGNENKYILAWTTTPWTLMANLGLAVGADINYSEIKDTKTGETYILASDRLKDYYKVNKEGNSEDFTLIREYKGTCLEGTKYEPIFNDFQVQLEDMNEDLGSDVKLGENVYSVVIGHHVTTESGTGIVHIAPAYGEDDFIIGNESKLGFVSHINDSGKTCNTLNDNDKYVFDYNAEVIETLKERGDVIKISTIDHSYPHCWRCDTPLIYRGISAWFVAVEKIRDKMVDNNQEINWTPEIIKNGRFGKWVAGAKDWNISRNRYWGSAIPVWQNEDKSEEVCIGSVKEMYELNKEYGQIEEKNGKYFYTNTNQEVDIHKHFVDEIFLKHPETGTKLKRIPEVLDCWFESGAMPYASKHYPFEENIILKNDLYISRHGEAENNIQNKLNGKIENKNIFSLTKKGISDLKNEAESFEGKFDYIICSPFKRTIQTAHIFQKKLGGKIIIDDRIRERNPGILELESINKMIPWIKERENIAPEGCETDKECRERGVNLLNEINNKYSGKKILIVTHSVLARLLPLYTKGEKKSKYKVAPKGKIVKLENSFKFPADFIAEGLDQTRGWFYTLLILGTALFDKAPMKNVIVNGIVLAEDGKKMSKSLNNYPDPKIIFDKYGADAMRFYLMNSPVVEAQDFRFTEEGVHEVVKKVILPLWNTYYFFTTYANIDNFKATGSKTRNNPLDKWLISELNELTKEVSTGFDEYKLNNATKPIVKFMDNLTNWYIRRSRKRFWKSENDSDKLEAYETLYTALVELTKIIAPFMPFISEHMYKELTGEKSVHLENFPKYDSNLIDEKLNKATDKVQKIITLGLAWRANQKIRVRQPLKSITITDTLDDYNIEIIKEELNVKEVLVVDGNILAKQICKPNGRAIGPKFGRDVKFIMSEAKSGNFKILENGNAKVGDFELEAGDFELVFESEDASALIEAGFGMVIAMDNEITKELQIEGQYRDIVRYIQEARKGAGYNVDDRIQVSITGADNVIKIFKKEIQKETLSTIVPTLKKFNIENTLENIVIRLQK